MDFLKHYLDNHIFAASRGSSRKFHAANDFGLNIEFKIIYTKSKGISVQTAMGNKLKKESNLLMQDLLQNVRLSAAQTFVIQLSVRQISCIE